MLEHGFRSKFICTRVVYIYIQTYTCIYIYIHHHAMCNVYMCIYDIYTHIYNRYIVQHISSCTCTYNLYNMSCIHNVFCKTCIIGWRDPPLDMIYCIQFSPRKGQVLILLGQKETALPQQLGNVIFFWPQISIFTSQK